MTYYSNLYSCFFKSNIHLIECEHNFFRLVEKAASGQYLQSNDTPPCPPRPPLYAPQDVVSERTLKVMLVFRSTTLYDRSRFTVYIKEFK